MFHHSLLEQFLSSPVLILIKFTADVGILQPFWFLFKYYPSSPGDHSIASKNLKQLTKLLGDGSVTCVRHRLVGGGLEHGIGKGFEEMKAGRVRGEKLVVRVGGES